jgi:anti-sigma regulatory factor (Ser/Thr protein kinase)
MAAESTNGNGSHGFHLELEAEPAAVAKARHASAEFARGAGFDSTAVEVAVSELVTNVVVHGYEEAGGIVGVDAQLEGSDLLITVADQGRGMSPHPDQARLGLGIALAGSLARSVEISRGDPRGTVVKVRFGPPAGAS